MQLLTTMCDFHKNARTVCISHGCFGASRHLRQPDPGDVPVRSHNPRLFTLPSRLVGKPVVRHESLRIG